MSSKTIIRRKINVITDFDKEISVINKKRMELDLLISNYEKKKTELKNKKDKKLIERIQALPDVIINIIFRFAVSCPHASKSQILNVFNQREKLRKQWLEWEKLPLPRQPLFNSFEHDMEYMQNHPDHDIYEIMHQRARHHDPCSITDIPTYCFTNGNILMGRVKIYLPYHIDTRVEDVNPLRRDATNKAIAWKFPDCEVEHYFSKTAWRGMNETGNYKQQKKKQCGNWVYGWGPIRIDNIHNNKTENYISVSFIDDLYYPSHVSVFNQLNYICSPVRFDIVKNFLKNEGIDVSNCRTRRECYRKTLMT